MTTIKVSDRAAQLIKAERIAGDTMLQFIAEDMRYIVKAIDDKGQDMIPATDFQPLVNLARYADLIIALNHNEELVEE